MSTQDTIEARVIDVIAKTQHIPLETLTMDSTFEQLAIDSLDGLQILFALEEEFGIDIPDEEGRLITSVRQAVAGVGELLARKAGTTAAQ
ncbi:MAG: acyl carrier protein [Bryobacteraceae bacterium]|nr:acyl carrier protein [Bryobacteraceae bacterium]